ncbi:MAG: hypothetical protein IKE61_01400 [Coriobacteriales bacterium]|nr:hypothetical protein [Coriobacteriales bacterium]
MVWILLKKQLLEVWRGYFFDAKTGNARSKASTAIRFALFALLMVVVLGGMFTGLAIVLCDPLTSSGAGWLYFVIMGAIAVLLGAFGAALNSFSSIYMAKDNDLLLSLPIPMKTILISRLLNVYLLGLMYTVVVLVPTLIVHWVTVELSAALVMTGLIWAILITALVLALSCLIGWVIAKINLKFRRKSFVAAFGVLAFLAIYFLFVSSFGNLIEDIATNAIYYGELIQESSSLLYWFGLAADGGWLALAGFAAVCAILLVLTWIVISRSFLHIATSSGKQKKAVYREKETKQKSPAFALLMKEFTRFTSSANYMINTGLGIVFLVLAGVLILWQGSTVSVALHLFFAGIPGATAILLTTCICMMSVMIDTAAPSVSLEGKSLWIVRSLPVSSWQILQSKANMQYILTAVPALFCSVCAVIAVSCTLVEALMLLLVPQVFALFQSHCDLTLGVLWPNLTWTSEVVPVKRGMAVLFSLIIGAVSGLILGGVFFLVGHITGFTLYFIIVIAVFCAATVALRLWLKRSGCRRFEAL